METPGDPPPESPLGAGLDLSDPNSPLAPYYLAPSHVAAVAALALVVFFYAIATLWHTDVWGHMKYGEWIAAHGSSPEKEPFCEFSEPSIPLVNFPWLCQLLFSWTYRTGEALAGGDEVRRLAGGVAALRTLGLATATAFSVFLLLACRRASGSWLAAALGLLAYNLLAPSSLGVLRPQLLGMALFACFLFMLAGKELSWRATIVLAAATALWANLHGSFVMGLALIGAFLAGRLLERSRTDGRWTPLAGLADPNSRRLLAALALAGGAAMLNPYGPWLYWHVLTFGGNPTVRTFDEFQPLNFTLGPLALAMYLLAAVLLAGSWLAARRPPSATTFVLVLLFGIIPLLQRRMLVWWMPLVPLLACPAWASLMSRGGEAELPGKPNFRYTVMAVLAAFMGLAFSPPVQSVIHGPAPLRQALARDTPWELAFVLEGTPVKGERADRLREGLKRAFPDGKFQGRIFASETAADYLLWRLPSPSGVLVYTHIHLFGMDHWTKCMQVKRGEKGWDALLDGWKANLVVVESATHPGLCAAISKHDAWRVVDGRPDALQGSSSSLFVAVRRVPLLP